MRLSFHFFRLYPIRLNFLRFNPFMQCQRSKANGCAWASSQLHKRNAPLRDPGLDRPHTDIEQGRSPSLVQLWACSLVETRT